MSSRFVALALMVATLAGCGGSGTPASAPRLLVSASAELPRASDLRGAGLPRDITTVPLDQAHVFNDTDPRGPCGAKVPDIDLRAAKGEAIRSLTVQGAAFVAHTTPAEAQRVVAARVADTHAGCAEFSITTNNGDAQRVHLDRVIALQHAGDQSLAVQQALLVGGKVTSVTLITVRRGGTLARVVLFAADPPAVATVRAVATRAASRLRPTR